MTISNSPIFSRAVLGKRGVVEESAAAGQEGERRRAAEAPQKHGHQRVCTLGESYFAFSTQKPLHEYRVTKVVGVKKEGPRFRDPASWLTLESNRYKYLPINSADILLI